MTRARVVVLPPGAASELVVVDVTLPDPQSYEVLVDVVATGVCHTQIDQIRQAKRDAPLVLGHEAAGIVREVGDRVTHVGAGDHVLLTWVPRNGSRVPTAASLVLDDGTTAGSRNIYTWATATVVDEQYVVKVPHDLPGDLTSIVGCAVMTGAGTVLHGGVHAGDSLVVWGAGGIGLSAIAAARVVGATPVIAVDVSDEKLALAAQMGADHTVNALVDDPVAAIRGIVGGGSVRAGADFAIDCTGLASNLARSLASVRPGTLGASRGGSVLIVGAVRDVFDVPGEELIIGQKNIGGFYGGACKPEDDFPELLGWFRQGRLDLDALVTNRYSLDQINQALDELGTGRVLGRAIVEL